MNRKFFIFKLKDEYLPDFVKKYSKLYKHDPYCGTMSNTYYIDEKHFRKLKIKNIEQKISNEDKILLEFLMNVSYTRILTQLEVDKYTGSHGVGFGGIGSGFILTQ
jgi:hypothetical protein